MKISIPHMGLLDKACAPVLESLGVHMIRQPRPNKRSLTLGVSHAPECACLPFKLNLGNMIEAIEEGSDTILMAGGFGPCRFGYYSAIQEDILKDLGYDFRMGTTDNPDKLSDILSTIKEISKLNTKFAAYRAFYLILSRILLFDYSTHLANTTRPYEKNKGETTDVYEEAITIIEKSKGYRGLIPAFIKVMKLFSKIEKDTTRKPLKVGLVGEIFMVLEPFANMEIEKRLGEMGVEVVRGVWLSDWLNERFRFIPFRRNQMKLATKAAYPYLKHNAGGESIVSVGKSIIFARKGIDGIVHIMPFTCMPEIIAQSILNRVEKDLDIPILTLIYDEHSTPGSIETRLEAFVDLLSRRQPI